MLQKVLFVINLFFPALFMFVWLIDISIYIAKHKNFDEDKLSKRLAFVVPTILLFVKIIIVLIMAIIDAKEKNTLINYQTLWVIFTSNLNFILIFYFGTLVFSVFSYLPTKVVFHLLTNNTNGPINRILNYPFLISLWISWLIIFAYYAIKNSWVKFLETIFW